VRFVTGRARSGSRSNGLVLVREAPRNTEIRPEALDAFITPVASRFVRTNFAIPKLDHRRYRVEVGGAVERPIELRLVDLRRLPQRTVVVTTECAGNQRTSLSPLPPGEPWLSGAVSTSTFTGVPLAVVLERAGLRKDAIEILAEGADSGNTPAGETRFARSLPAAKALDTDTLLALEMNGRPLAPAHGGPVRLVVPGWYGMASVKWVSRISALSAPFAGYFQTERYVFVEENGRVAQPVREMRVKAMFSSPAPGATVEMGPVLVSGRAWSGAGRVVKVEVAVGGGSTWVEARLTGPEEKHAWRRWELTWVPVWRGRHVLRCRATDESGNVQPDVPRWNALGYGANGVQSLVVDVR
jgi:DMSO/TMAO reductase YedYZ molybdopterin-dependent catalytic subunit